MQDLIDEIYYTIVRVKIGGREMEFDARPSDAITLALHHNAPIFVEKRVLDIAGVRVEDNASKG